MKNLDKIKDKKTYFFIKKNSILLILILLFGLALRIGLFSGFGLGDDINYFSSIFNIFYRFNFEVEWPYYYQTSIWIPIVTLWKIFGISEYTFIAPVLISSILSIYAVYKILNLLYSEEAGLIGAFLMSAYPFDVTFSTLFSPDIVLTMLMSVSFYYFIKAESKNYNKISFYLSALLLLLAAHAKITAFFILPVYILFILLNFKNFRKYSHFFIALILFVSLSLSVTYYLAGDPLAYYHSLKSASGQGKIDLSVMFKFPNQFWNIHPYGTLIHGFYFHIALIAFLLTLSSFLIAYEPLKFTRDSYKVLIYLLVIFFFMEFLPHTYTNGVFTSNNRLERYAAIMALPCVLFISFFIWKLYTANKKIFYLSLTLLTLSSLYFSYSTSYITRDSFSDWKDAGKFMRTLPEKRIYSDLRMVYYLAWMGLDSSQKGKINRWDLVTALRSENFYERQKEVDNIESGYVITGGSRLPHYYYGCDICITKIEGINIPPNWKLITVFDKPLTPWRSESMRVWEVS